jgi:hypothetical protein
MIRLIAIAGFALAFATSAQAITPTPLLQPDSVITQVRFGCGPGQTMRNGTCVSRSEVRQNRRCARWNGGVCAEWQ